MPALASAGTGTGSWVRRTWRRRAIDQPASDRPASISVTRNLARLFRWTANSLPRAWVLSAAAAVIDHAVWRRLARRAHQS